MLQATPLGGNDATWTDLASVEILDESTHHSRWLNITPLPTSCHLISSIIIHDSLYLLGGSLGKQLLLERSLLLEGMIAMADLNKWT